MSDVVPVPLAVTSTRAEEWDDDDFDIPGNDSLIEHIQKQEDVHRDESYRPSRPTYLRMSTGPEEDEELRDFFPTGDDIGEQMDSHVATALNSGSATPVPSREPAASDKLTSDSKVSSDAIDEDWDAEFDLKPSEKIAILPPQFHIAPSDDDLSAFNAEEDDGNISTIKVSKVPFPSSDEPVIRSDSSSFLLKPDDEDLLDAFELPEDVSHLSLRPLSHRPSKGTIISEWSSDAGSSLVSDSPSSYGFSGTGHQTASASPSSAPTSDYTDDDGEGDVDGVELPESLLPKDLVKILDAKKRGIQLHVEPPIKELPLKRAMEHDEDEDNFEKGLVIDDDRVLTRSRLRSGPAVLTPKPRTTTLSPKRRAGQSRAVPVRANTSPTVSGKSLQRPRDIRSPSPLPTPRSSSENQDSATRNLLARARAAFPSRSSAISPPLIRPPSSSRAKQTVTASTYSMLTIPRGGSQIAGPTSPVSRGIRSQKSHSKLILSKNASPKRGLVRKGSLNSLVDAQVEGEELEDADKMDRSASLSPVEHRSPLRRKRGNSGSGSSGPPSATSSLGRTHQGSVPRYNAPTLSSRAKTTRSGESTPITERATSHFVVPRPTTPSTTPGTNRLTMPTASTRAKARLPVSSVFPTTSASALVNRAGNISPVPRGISPFRTNGFRGGPQIMRRPRVVHKGWGDGTELDSIEDLPVEKEKERRFRKQPKNLTSSNGSSGSRDRDQSAGSINDAAVTSASGRKTPSGLHSLPASEAKRPSSSLSVRATGGSLTKSASDTGTIGRRKPLRESPIQLKPSASLKVPPQSSNTSRSSHSTARRRRVGDRGPIQRKPTLIRNLGGVGATKVIGEMRWNPVSLRWEGNESALRGFESPTHSTRPALITQLTGSSIGGLGSPAGLLASGARIVGDMIFDPSKMCWINRYEEEADPFADLSDSDKESTWGKSRGNTIRARTITGTLAAPSLGTPLEPVAGSPARSAISRGSTAPSESDFDTLSQADSSARNSLEAADGSVEPSDSAIKPRRLSVLLRGASTSPIPGVDDEMIEAAREAEARHRMEVQGWFPRTRTPSASSVSASQRAGIITFDDDDDDLPDRSYLFEIRTLATKPY